MGEQDANGRRVADATVGVIANPMSGRDMRPKNRIVRRRIRRYEARFPQPRWIGHEELPQIGRVAC